MESLGMLTRVAFRSDAPADPRLADTGLTCCSLKEDIRTVEITEATNR